MSAMLMMVMMVLMSGGADSDDRGSDVADEKETTPGPNTFT